MANLEQGSSGNLTPLLNGVTVLPYTVLGNGKTTVASAGTRVQLASSTSIASVTLRAGSANTNMIYVGTSTVSSSNGFQLAPDETVSIDINNLSKVWLDADTNGNFVTYIYLA